jgi:predicted Zn-dependent peptidase
VTKEIFGPQQEFLDLAYRFKGAGTEDELYVTLISDILFNGHAGLFDLNLNQAQIVQNVRSSTDFNKDYGVHQLTGRPKQGQTLEEVKDLMLGQVEKIKKGEFDEWLLQAIINDEKLSFMRLLERSFIRAYYMIDGYINEIPHSEVVSFIDRLSKITKEKLVAFANENYKDNYAVLYKRTGPNSGLVKVEKPKITAVEINRKNLLAEKVPPIEPVFVDFSKALKKEELKPGVGLFFAPNQINGIFELSYVIDIGKNHNINLSTAFDYMSLLGTDKFSPEDLKKELYKYGLTLNMSASARSCNLRISGLDEYLDKGIELLEQVISSSKPDQEIYKNYIDRVIKARTDAKKNMSSIRSAMEDYGTYGEDSPTRYLIPEDKLRSINPAELTSLAATITSYPHKISYYGPSSFEKVKGTISKYHRIPGTLKTIPEIKSFKCTVNQKPNVYVVDYDISQANISILFNDIPFVADIVPYAQIFNNFYNPIVFQEIREAKGLAYTATASYRTPAFADQMTKFTAFIGTQADKLKIATESMGQLMKNMPGDENYFKLSNDGLISSISTQRITNSMLFNSWLNNKNLGIDYDIRKNTYEKAREIKLDEMRKFFTAHVSSKSPTYLVLGNKKMLDMKALAKIGEVKELKLEEIFGY